jgi:hypothetical protein
LVTKYYSRGIKYTFTENKGSDMVNKSLIILLFMGEESLMDMFFGIIGFVGMIIFGIIAMVSVFKKSGKAKKNFIISGVCFAMFVLGLSMPSSETTDETSTELSEQVD